MNGVERKEKIQITQEESDIARILFRKGNKITTIAQTIGCNPSTVSKIKAAGFDLKTYLENRRESNRQTAENKKKAAEVPEVIDYTTAPIEGQMEMDLEAAQPEKKPEHMILQ